MTEPAKDLWEELMCNTLMHGTGFLKMQMNSQGGFDMSIVPIEDYRYLDVKFDKPETVMAEYKPQTYAAYWVDGKIKIGVVPEDILKQEGDT